MTSARARRPLILRGSAFVTAFMAGRIDGVPYLRLDLEDARAGQSIFHLCVLPQDVAAVLPRVMRAIRAGRPSRYRVVVPPEGTVRLTAASGVRAHRTIAASAARLDAFAGWQAP